MKFILIFNITFPLLLICCKEKQELNYTVLINASESQAQDSLLSSGHTFKGRSKSEDVFLEDQFLVTLIFSKDNYDIEVILLENKKGSKEARVIQITLRKEELRKAKLGP